MEIVKICEIVGDCKVFFGLFGGVDLFVVGVFL